MSGSQTGPKTQSSSGAAGPLEFTQLRLSLALHLSPATTFRAVRRLTGARLWDQSALRVDRAGAAELLIHGVRWVFPCVPGALVRGVPTAHSGPPLHGAFASEQLYVWPDEGGTVAGAAVEPLHPCTPFLVDSLHGAYELLTLVDALRVGRARERTLAAKLLRERLGVA